jgi:hypothetical protein
MDDWPVMNRDGGRDGQQTMPTPSRVMHPAPRRSLTRLPCFRKLVTIILTHTASVPIS